jgi:Fic family protein
MNVELLEVEKKHLLSLKKEVDQALFVKIDDDFKIKYAHDAVHIEGENSTEKRISELEQKELLNHIKAYDHVRDEALKGTVVSEDLIKDVHQQILEDIMPGGLYRQVNIGLKGQHQPPDYVKVYDRMKKLINDLEFSFKGTAIEKAAYIHLTIGKIHPFIDGNGRLGRLMMNYYLIQNDYLPISISDNDKEAYFAALDQFKIQKSMTKMVDLIVELLLERYNEVNQKLH